MSEMAKYEYWTLESHLSNIPRDRMNEAGAAGWEMFFYAASAANYRYFFRRTLITAPPSTEASDE